MLFTYILLSLPLKGYTEQNTWINWSAVAMNWRQQDSERLTKREIFKESTKSECKYTRKELNQ